MVYIKTVILNCKKLNWDNKLDFTALGEDVIIYDDSTREEIIERSKGADIIVSKELKIDKEIIDALDESVLMIAEAGTGYNNIDIEACRNRNIWVSNIPAYSTKRVAHTAIMLMLNLASSMQKQIKSIANKDYSNFEYLNVDHMELNGKVLGIIGTGRIGTEVAKIADALGMKVIAYTRSKKEDTDVIHYVSLEELILSSDVISLHCALTDETYHIIDDEKLTLMKNSAFLINTSRGALIDEAALINGLKTGKLRGAGLDVYEEEPLSSESELFTLDNVVLTPHMGWKAIETRQRLVDILVDNIKSFEEGNPQNIVSI